VYCNIFISFLILFFSFPICFILFLFRELSLFYSFFLRISISLILLFSCLGPLD
jgi:hypothetical protein